jgi:hypothetical protein
MPRTAALAARWTAALVVAPLLLWACHEVTFVGYWQRRSVGALGLYGTRLVLMALAAAAWLFAFGHAVRARPRRVAGRCWLVAMSLLLTLLVLEAVFMFVPQSHNVGYTMAGRIWHERYWGEPNALGYRDVEPVPQPGKKLVLVVGDSFTAGAGVADVRDRFPDVAAMARPDLQVVNLGVCGSETEDELRRLHAHPLRPDVLVLQYYPNDVDGAAQRAGHAPPPFTPFHDVGSIKLQRLLLTSFLANFVYWQFPHDDGAGYERFLARVHADPEVSRLHHADLEGFCTFADERRIPLVVVLFPVLEDLGWSRTNTAPVKRLFTARGIPVLDVADLIDDLGVRQRTVNHHDGHASELVHRRVGEALARLLPR